MTLFGRGLSTAIVAAVFVAALGAVPGHVPGRVPGTRLLHQVTVTNKTDKCAWITLYVSTGLDPGWHIKHSPDNARPQWLRPGETRASIVDDEQLKVRAEVNSNADCSGHTIKDTYDIVKIGWNNVHNRNAVLVPSGNGYNLWFQD